MKVCSKCSISKRLIEFHKQSKSADGYRPECKVCDNDRKKIVYREKKLAQYGLNLDQYEQMLLNQGGVCKVCGKEEIKKAHQTGTPYQLAVDHDHLTGKVRGLLCCSCNLALGYVRDDILILKNMIVYLEES